MSNKPKLCLGTVSFGMDYGLGKKVSDQLLANIQDLVNQHSCIDMYDTSSAYQSAFGRIYPRIYNKKINYKVHYSNFVVPIMPVHSYMFHHETVPPHWVKSLLERVGSDAKIGISSYEALTAEVQIGKYGFKMCQFPINILNRHFEPFVNNWRGKIELHARSVFNQGILPKQGKSIKECLKYVLDLGVDYIVVGVHKPVELREILDAYFELS